MKCFTNVYAKSIPKCSNMRFCQQIQQRSFTSTIIPSAKEKSKKVDESKLPLHLTPKKWRGLPSKEIVDLYHKRIATLGGNYTQDPAEFEALLSTSEEFNVSYKEIEEAYESNANPSVIKFGRNPLENYFPKYTFDEYATPARETARYHAIKRHYNRLAAYELPLLSKYRQTFVPPAENESLKLRYTTYLGEDHPADRKVVLSSQLASLNLNPKETHKFKLLAGPRYDHKTDEFKMSSEKFAEPAQNARDLSEILQKLLVETKDLKDDFSDIPLDTRHTDAKYKKKQHRKVEAKFPAEWERPQDAPIEKFDVIGAIKEKYV